VLLRQHAAQVRYTIACTAMLLLMALPVVTLYLLYPSSSSSVSRNQILHRTESVESTTLSETPLEEKSGTIGRFRLSSPRIAGLCEYVKPYLPWLVFFWLIGVVFLSLRMAGGWLYVRYLMKWKTQPISDLWRGRLHRLSQQLHIHRSVRFLVSAEVGIPIVLGWLRPAILMPVGMLTGLTAQQVEAIVIHELAHIRRYDYLINLVQTIAETLLFYHPATWWISHQIRMAREYCCDDRAVAICRDASTYAHALTLLEERRTSLLRLAVAASEYSLLGRIRRLTGFPPLYMNHRRWIDRMTLPPFMTLIAGLLILGLVSISSVAANPEITMPEGMVSYWKLDEGSGLNTSDCIGNNHGRISGATWVAGIAGNSLSFDGVNDYVKIPDHPSLEFTNSISVEFWMKPERLDAWQSIVDHHHHAPQEGYALGINNENKLQLGIPGLPHGNLVSSKVLTSSDLNKWWHVVGTYDGSYLRIYINGKEDASTPSSGTMIDSEMGFYLARVTWATANLYKGIIDEIAINGRALTPEEIKRHYENRLRGVGI